MCSFIECETVTIICLNPPRETLVYFAVKTMKCSYIYESGLDLIQKLFTLKLLMLTRVCSVYLSHNKSCHRLALSNFHMISSRSLRQSLGREQTKGKKMFPWVQQTFLGEEDHVTSPKNVCVRGYRLITDVCFFCFFLENVDELESEGVSNLHSTGARLSKVQLKAFIDATV